MSWPRPAGVPPCRWSPCLVDGPGRRQRLLGQLVFGNLSHSTSSKIAVNNQLERTRRRRRSGGCYLNGGILLC